MLKTNRLHIVALDVPYPADYGGAIDIFYRVKALHDAGLEIVIHCYEYGRGEQDALASVATEVHYYKREKRLLDWFSSLPFIVKTRSSKRLLKRLLSDDAPILFEGLHTCFFLNDERLNDRITLVRAHNVEHDYYRALAEKSSGSKKTYFTSEARKLERFEKVIQRANHVLAIQEKDVAHFNNMHSSVHLLRASVPPLTAAEQTSTKPYCLFHGNLSVPENESAAIWIIDALSKEGIPIKVAGKNPSPQLVERCNVEHIELIANPDTSAMEHLIKGARVHVLHTDQSTGLKLKLIAALDSSGQVLANTTMLKGTGLGQFCEIQDDPGSYASAARNMLEQELSNEAFQQRKAYLKEHFDTATNAQLIVKLISD